MAVLTLTSTANMNASPRGVHVGVNHLEWDFNAGTGVIGTISDVILLGKIPNGAVILDKNVNFGAVAGVTAQSWALTLLAVEALGTYSQYANLTGSLSASTGAVSFSNTKPFKVSLSDDRAVQYVVLALNCTTGTSATASFSTQGFVTYAADGSNL